MDIIDDKHVDFDNGISEWVSTPLRIFSPILSRMIREDRAAARNIFANLATVFNRRGEPGEPKDLTEFLSRSAENFGKE